MPGAGRIAHELGIAMRLGGRAMKRRLAAGRDAPQSEATRQEQLLRWLDGLPSGRTAGRTFVRLPASEPPWHDTGLDLERGDTVTLLAQGRVYLSRALDIWVGPSFQLWARIGAEGPVFRGTRSTNTFTAEQSGRLWLASYFPGEWADPSGRLGTDPAEYSRVSGGLSVLVIRWAQGTDAAGVFRDAIAAPDTPELVRDEAERQRAQTEPPPGWSYLWYLGPGEIYRPVAAPDSRPAILCHTHGDVGILRRDAEMPLRPGLELRWRWKVDELPIDLAEDTLPSHDYLSIAVEFDDGQDITYYWSASLPVGTVYRCPLPTWKDKETHVVVRSGPSQLGQWLEETRDLGADYRSIIDGPASKVVRIWLIANSLFQRGHGRCEYSAIRLQGPDGTVEVL
jgi:hypothetical protein